MDDVSQLSEEDVNRVARVVVGMLAASLQGASPVPRQEDWVKLPEVCRVLGVKKSWLYALKGRHPEIQRNVKRNPWDRMGASFWCVAAIREVVSREGVCGGVQEGGEV